MSAPDTTPANEQNEEQPQVTLEEALKLAQGHHQTGNFILAERTYRDILRAVPDHHPTTQYLGILLFQSGNLDEALIYLQKATEASPEDLGCWNNYGAALTQLERYEEAVGAYDKALSIDASYLDALNNYAYTLWVLERFDEAEEKAKAALDVDSSNVNALMNMGMILARLERHEDALDLWEKGSQIAPDNAAVWSNWGNTLREVGRIAESEDKCRKAVELDPENTDALNNLANALRDMGRIDEAVEHYREATDLKPEFYHAHHNLAIALIDNMDYKKAAAAARYAVAFKKDFGNGYSSLSRALRELGNYDQAHQAAQKAIQLDPDDASPYLEMADVLLRADRLDDGQAAMEEALRRDPDSPRALMKLAEIRERLNDMSGALESIDQAIEINPNMPILLLKKAQILNIGNELDEAIEIISKVIELSPEWLMAKQLKAEMLLSLNETEESEKLVRQVLAVNPNIPGPYSTLTSLKKFTSEDDEDYKGLLKASEHIDSYGLEGKSSLHFTFSNVYEQMKDYDRAFDHLKQANDAKRKLIPYDSTKIPAKYNGIKKQFNPEFMEQVKGKGNQSDSPVFIIGMPRSGTTLTEQIISSHPDVFGAGELPDIGLVRSGAEQSENDLVALGEDYLERVKTRTKGADVKRVTDKMPGNYMQVGFIDSILPNAKIIHCMRNPIDTCLSCYKQNFSRGQYWSYDLEELAAEYKRYLDVMAYWRETLPGRILEITYEDTVGKFEEQARKLIDHVGLDWDDACLEPHKQKRAVLTASKAQVTKPVYKTSVDKWKRYEKGLQPLVRELLPDQVLPVE